jgi:hypothetical protein
VKVRLHGTRAEVAEATGRLVEILDVVAVSDPHPDRGRACWSASTSRSTWTRPPRPARPGLADPRGGSCHERREPDRVDRGELEPGDRV